MANLPMNVAVADYLRCLEAPTHHEPFSQLKLQVGTAALTRLGETTLRLLTWLANSETKAAQAVSELEDDDTRAVVADQLWSVSQFLSLLASQTGVSLNLRPMEALTAAVRNLKQGINSPLLVTGALKDRVVCKQYTYSDRIIIQGRAAAAVEHLLRSSKEKSQMAAARRVARALEAGGYTSGGARKQKISADTVKRWHNAALPAADDTGFCLGSIFDIYMRIDSDRFRRKYGLNPNSLLDDLAKMCRALRIPG